MAIDIAIGGDVELDQIAPNGNDHAAIEQTVFTLVPTDVCFRGKTRMEGNFWVADVWVQAGGGAPRHFTVRVDMAQIVRDLQAQRSDDPEISGMFDFVKKGVRSIGNAAKSIGRNKIVKGISRGVKSVIRHPATGAIVKAAQVAVPAVGVPAAAAYQGANSALAALDQRGNILKKVLTFHQHAAAGALDVLDPADRIPAALKNSVKQFLKTGKLDRNLLQQTASIAGPEAAKALMQAGRATGMLREVAQRANAGDPRAQMQRNILKRINLARKQLSAQKAQLVAMQQRTLPRPGMPRVLPPFAQGQPVPRFPTGSPQMPRVLPPFAQGRPVPKRRPFAPPGFVQPF